jgi:GT2 family glycosyltransferase
MNERLYILVPVHNRRATTVHFVEALNRQTWRGYHLILIDDGSTDGTAEAVRAICPATEVIVGTGDWWWAGCLDQACRHLQRQGVADDDVLLLINDDVVVKPDFLERALAEFAPMRDTLLLARQVDAATGTEIDFGGGVRADLFELRFAAARQPEEINCLPTRGLFLRWRDYCRTGGFRPEQLPHYLSDYEFTLRAGRNGLALRIARTAALGVKAEQTGPAVKTIFEQPRADRFRLLFSRRFKDNPVTWSVFVRLAAPPTRQPYLWLKIWLNFLLLAARCGYRPVQRAKPCRSDSPRS